MRAEPGIPPSSTPTGRAARRAHALLAPLLDALLPCHCLDCFTIEPGAMHLGLCSRCRSRLVLLVGVDRLTCAVCGRELHGSAGVASTRCLPCMRTRSPIDRLFAVWRYEPPLDAVIRGLKFQNLPYLGAHLGRELESRLPSSLEVDAVVPVPLHWWRSWQRGYNQAAEMARPLARARGWPVAKPLSRLRATPAQTGIGRSRRLRNLSGAFGLRWRRGLRPEGLRLLLVDDVYTTGATVRAAARALKSGGASWVGAAVACRTSEPWARRASGPLPPL